MKPETKRWLKQSEEGFKTADINFKAKKYFSAAFIKQISPKNTGTLYFSESSVYSFSLS